MKLIGFNKQGNSYQLVFERDDERIELCTVENGYGLKDVLHSGEGITEMLPQTATLLMVLRLRAYKQRLRHGDNKIVVGGLVLLSVRDLNREYVESGEFIASVLEETVGNIANYYPEQQARINAASDAFFITEGYDIIPIKETKAEPPKATKPKDSLPAYVDNDTDHHVSLLGKLVGGRLCPWGHAYTNATGANMQLAAAGYDIREEASVSDFYIRGVPAYTRAYPGDDANSFRFEPLTPQPNALATKTDV